ncbi:MAG: exo-alpha-sialidase [Clostridia bacterium]|nr:exo-alpha-sialidase [Clostridia bacterium]
MSKDNSLLPASYITDPVVLHDKDGVYADGVRKFQGIPGIECTKGGRTFTVFYTGTEGEGDGNFLLLQMSEDGVHFGKSFMAVIPPTSDTRCYDPTLWISPDGKLRLYWAQSFGWYDGRCGVWEAVCDEPDAPEVRFGEPRRIANGIMMNKPTVRDDGAWLLPCAVWAVCNSEYNWLPDERFSNVYISTDNGETFSLLGGADYPNRHFDEHMVIQRNDGRVAMYIRGKSDIGVSLSDDGGKTWSRGVDMGVGNPNSRFCIRRLPSGRLLLVNHVKFTGRNNLAAMLSEDDGETWIGGLMLDERAGVSYPDMAVSADGKLNIIYDWNRTSDKEILLARVTEEDILAGKLVDEGSALRILVNKATGTAN